MAEATKATTPKITLPKEVFNVEVNSHDLIKRAYDAYLANGRENYAVTKTRGLVRGGGKKPWRQKGTGRARFGSSRNPIWRGGGIVFGPMGIENYTITIPTAQKRQATRQALTLANKSKKVTILDMNFTSGKTKDVVAFMEKNKLSRQILLVVDEKDVNTERATRNVPDLKVVQAMYLNVYDIMNADAIVMNNKAVEVVKNWLAPAGGSNA